MKHIAVIGAGITGVTTAYALLQRGYRVTVYDRNRYAAMATSFANGGQLSASNGEVWNQTSTILKGMRWMFKNDAPLLITPKPSWHKLSWMVEFIASIPRYEANTTETVRLAMASREHLLKWAEREDISFDYESRGIMHMYARRQGFDHATRVNRLMAAGGLEREQLTATQMREIEPSLVGDFVGGYFTRSDATGDIHKFTLGLARACERLGAEFKYDTRVQSLARYQGGVTVTASQGSETIRSEFDAMVICAGVKSRDFAAELGDRVNIYPVKGYSITIPLDDEQSQQAAPWTSLLDDDAKIVTSRLGVDRFRIAGTAEFNGENYDIRANRIDPLVDWCRSHFPGVDTEHVVPWCGLRPMMPNMMPRVGAGKAHGVYYNTGHGHLGWTLSPITAEMIGDIITNSLPNKSTMPLANAA